MLLALAGVAAPASARTSPENAASTHAYLLATNTLDEAELRGLPQEAAARESLATRISGECPGIVAGAPPHEEVFGFGLTSPIQGAPANPRAEGERRRQSRQLGDLKLELLFALAGSRTQANREATLALIDALTPLRWSDSEITLLLHLTVEDLQEELTIAAPPVCADMRAWVASGYKTLSPVSKERASRSEALLRRTLELVGLATQTQIEPLPKMLAPYEDAADRALARHTEALTAQLEQGQKELNGALKRLEVTVGLPAKKEVREVKRTTRKPAVIGRGRTAAGTSFVARAERTRSAGALGCSAEVTITEASRPSGGLLSILSGEGTGRCLSRSHVDPGAAVHCSSGLLTIEADLLRSTSSVRLLLSDGATVTSPAIRVPARLGGPAGLYYQVVRGPSPIPVSLTELDAQGGTLAVLKLPAVVECTKHPVKYFPDGIVRLARESPPQGPSFTIRGEGYRKFGVDHFELKLSVSNETLLFSNDGGDDFESGVAINGMRGFEPHASSGCEPQPYAIVYGLLTSPRDEVLARVSGTLVPLRKVSIPARLHADGALAYGSFSPLPSELLVRNASGETVGRKNLAKAAKSATETCEGEGE